MSIQRRLAISVTLVLVFSLIVGFVLTYEHVISKVRTEMQAALSVGVYSARNSIGDPNGIADPGKKLRRIVADFNGDRHLKAVLAAPDGAVIAQSRLLPPDDPAPLWFYRLATSAPQSRSLQLPAPLASLGTLELQPDPRNEVAEAWSDTKLTLTVMAVFFAMVLLLAFITLKTALAPLRDVKAALERVGSGDYKARIGTNIPRELTPVRVGFNHMAERLEEMGRQNRALNDQIMTLQEEERAELARDLHDEVAPFLFGVGADATMMRQFIASRSYDELAPRAEAISDAVKHMQRHLKNVLRRLAPGALLDLGLAGAIENVTDFWKARQPDVSFAVEVTGEPLDPPLDAVAFRVVQESLSNAMRHGQPRAVHVRVDVDDDEARLCIEDDGTGFADGKPPMGFGLTGMQERVRSVGGTISVRNREDGHGVVVEAVLPIDGDQTSVEAQKMDMHA